MDARRNIAKIGIESWMVPPDAILSSLFARDLGPGFESVRGQLQTHLEHKKNLIKLLFKRRCCYKNTCPPSAT